MKNLAGRLLYIAGFAFFTSGCVADQNSPQFRLEQQSVTGLNWVQQSGEYEALAYQAFNAARKAFDEAHVPAGRKKAVIADLDETMIDNSAYAVWRVKHAEPYTEATWKRWMQAQQARTIVGALAFARYVNSHGGRMFYISNRDATSYDETFHNLKKLGFPGLSPETVLLRTGSSNKQERFDRVKASGYNVVVYAGDNLNDFDGIFYHKNNRERRLLVATRQNTFGTKFIILPNPNYGDWKNAMAKDYYKLSPTSQLDINRKLLRSWGG